MRFSITSSFSVPRRLRRCLSSSIEGGFTNKNVACNALDRTDRAPCTSMSSTHTLPCAATASTAAKLVP